MNKTIGIIDFDGNLINSMPVYTETFSEILFRMFGISLEEPKGPIYSTLKQFCPQK